MGVPGIHPQLPKICLELIYHSQISLNYVFLANFIYFFTSILTRVILSCFSFLTWLKLSRHLRLSQFVRVCSPGNKENKEILCLLEVQVTPRSLLFLKPRWLQELCCLPLPFNCNSFHFPFFFRIKEAWILCLMKMILSDISPPTSQFADFLNK